MSAGLQMREQLCKAISAIAAARAARAATAVRGVVMAAADVVGLEAAATARWVVAAESP